MFARDGKGATDDPYNFDIAADDSRYGSGKKTSSGGTKSWMKAGGSKLSGGGTGDAGSRQQPRPGEKKFSLNMKDGRRSPNAGIQDASLGPPDGVDHVRNSMASFNAWHTSASTKTAPLRASTPAGNTSALDKAMGFLNKYTQGGVRNSDAGTPPTKANTPVAGSRQLNGGDFDKSSRNGRRTNYFDDDIDDMDILLSSSEDADDSETEPQKQRMTRTESTHGLQRHIDKHGDAVDGGKSKAPMFPMKVDDAGPSLTGARSSGRFPTAEDLGIRVEEVLGQSVVAPKVAVSPLGAGHATNRRSNAADDFESGYNNTARDDHDAPEPTDVSSAVRLTVNIPGSRHAHALGATSREPRKPIEGDVHDASSTNSVESKLSRSIEKPNQSHSVASSREHNVDNDQQRLSRSSSGIESSCGVNDEGELTSISPTANCNTGKEEEGAGRGANGRDFDRGIRRGDGGSRDNVVSSNDLALVGHHVSFASTTPVASEEPNVGDEQGVGTRSDTANSTRIRNKANSAETVRTMNKGSSDSDVGGSAHEEEEEEEGDDEDDYEDDDFEELEATAESDQYNDSPKDEKMRRILPSNYTERYDDATLAQATASTTMGTASEFGKGNAVDDRGEGPKVPCSRQAWAEPRRDDNTKQSQTISKSTTGAQSACSSPGSPTDRDATGIGGRSDDANKAHDDGGMRATSKGGEMKVAWGIQSVKESRQLNGYQTDSEDTAMGTVGRARNSITGMRESTKGCGSVAQIVHPDQSEQLRPGRRQTAPNRNAGENPVSTKRGVVIDRSCEVIMPGPSPASPDVKNIVRAETVAVVEYAHDPERDIDLRSIGTQATGTAAAVQANISVPGMIGTHSVLDASLLGADTEETRTAGVGYRPGESYAKWGRFACDVPSYRLPGGLAHAKPGLNFAPPPPASDFSERRVQPSTGDPAIDEAAENTVRSNDDGSGSTQESSSRRTPGDGRKQRFSDAREHRPPFGRGIPTYLQMFLNAMAESQAESCAAWQCVIEETVRPPGIPSFPATHQTNEGRPAAPSTKEGVESFGTNTGPGAGVSEETRWSAANLDAVGAMMATQETFRKQLADMRENFNRIRSRAEAAGCQHRHAYNYESLADARDFLDRIRPAATSHAEALAKVDPSLAPGQAAAGEKRTDTPAESNAVEELKARQHDKNDGNSSPAVE